MSTSKTFPSWAIAATLLLAAAGVLHAQSDLGGWQKITAIPDAKTHLVPRTWTLDKYPDAPTLMPHSKVTVLDQEGPGVVTNFHASNYAGGRVWRIEPGCTRNSTRRSSHRCTPTSK